MVVIVMGAAGAGKTTIGRALADAMGWPFVDGDDRHSAANVDKMRRGIALSDADRAPWLAELHAIVARAIDRRAPLVLACSALKQRYRDTLRGDCRQVRFVHLAAREPLLRARLEQRRGHFARAQLLPSQLAALEEPQDAVTVDASLTPERIVDTIRTELGL
jgi:gluconokinase